MGLIVVIAVAALGLSAAACSKPAGPQASADQSAAATPPASPDAAASDDSDRKAETAAKAAAYVP